MYINPLGGGGGGTLILSYIRKLGSFLGFEIFEFQYFFFWGGGGGVQKNEYFWGYEDFVDFLGVITKFGLYLGVISMHFRVFFYGQGKERGGLGLLKFQKNGGGVQVVTQLLCILQTAVSLLLNKSLHSGKWCSFLCK